MVNFGIRKRKLRRKRGASLVEVLVATAIIAGGLLVIMRLFPTGLTGLKHAEKVNFAGRLCQLEIERLGNSAASLPDAIVAKELVGGSWVINTDVHPGDYAVGPNGLPRALDEIRDVVGEVANIPLDPTIYVSLFAPIALDAADPEPVVYGARYRRLTDQDVWYYGGIPTGCYTINLIDGELTFNDSEIDNQFRISYRYVIDDNGTLITYNVVGEAFTLAENPYTVQGAAGSPPGAFVGIVEGSDYVYRAFNRVDWAGSWTAGDPYEYKLDPNLGIFVFRDQLRGQQVRIDYRVASWQTICEERMIPSVDPNDADWCLPLRLLMPGVKAEGYVDDDEKEFLGLPGTADIAYYHSPGDAPVNVMVVDTDRNRVIFEKKGQVQSGFTADFLHGILFFDDEYADRRVKIYYQTEDEFALQTTKAVIAYSLAADYASQAYSEYSFSFSGMNRVYLNFHRCELGKVVTVDYEYQLVNAPDGGRVYRKIGEMCTVHEPLSGGQGYFSETGFGVTLNDGDGNDLADQVELDGTPYDINRTTINVLSVRGVSVKARAFWKERAKWDRRALDTYITRQ